MTTATSTRSVSARIAQRLAQSLGPRRYRMWFDRSARLDYADDRGRLRVTVPNRFVADWIEKHFHEDIRHAAQQELGNEVELDVQVQPDWSPPPSTPHALSGATPVYRNRNQVFGCEVAEKQVDPTSTAEPITRGPDGYEPAGASRAVGFTPSATGGRRPLLKHSLESFIVGPTNELAYAAAMRVVDLDQSVGSPLCIHGRCGLGKTHLLQGLCAKILRMRPGARVLYTTGEQFTNEFLSAMRANKVDPFRKRLRSLDLLAVDDVHFLANKQATQQEFLHTFDSIDLGGSRVVLASDCHPKLIKQFTEALVSRCVRGLVVEVQSPDHATRLKIIDALARRRGLKLLHQVADDLAQRSTGSVRDLEGTIAKLHALAFLSADRGHAPNPETASSSGSASPDEPRCDDHHAGLLPVGHALLNQMMQHHPLPTSAQPVSVEAIATAVAQTMGMTRTQILGKSRHRHAVMARSILVHIARQRTTLSFPEIAAAMDRCTHSTVVTAAHRIKKQLAAGQLVTTPAQSQPVPIRALLHQVEQTLAHGSSRQA